jgi:transcriptional regulator with XRE-family HTH domain
VFENLRMTLKDLREAKSLTQMEVAVKIGTTPTTVSNWERGAQEPRLAQIQALAKLYGVSADEIIQAVQNSKQS